MFIYQSFHMVYTRQLANAKKKSIVSLAQKAKSKINNTKKVNRKVQEEPQADVAANP